MINFSGPDGWFNATKDLLNGAILVNEDFVNINDLVGARPGKVVRCAVNPNEAVMFIPPQLLNCDFIAGMISDEA